MLSGARLNRATGRDSCHPKPSQYANVFTRVGWRYQPGVAFFGVTSVSALMAGRYAGEQRLVSGMLAHSPNDQVDEHKALAHVAPMTLHPDLPGTPGRRIQAFLRTVATALYCRLTGSGAVVTEETWHAARLIPTSGIAGAEEQERRATSALLAVIGAVREFGRGLLSAAGAPAGNVETFIEVPFKLGERDWRPDGLIRVARGTRTWTALVEVKTGKNNLQTEQLEAYLDIAREQGFDALITISNELPPSPDQHPTPIDRRKLRKVALHHWSWADVLSAAVVQKEHRGVSDPDQAWILGELIRYLEHPKSGALEFDDMGPDWVTIREAVVSGTLRPNDKTIPDVTARFDALLRYAALHLGRRLGTDVTVQMSRKERSEPATRAHALRTSLVESGTLHGSIRIPDTVGDMHVTADLRAGQVTCHVDLDAPRTGRPTTRINWLVRQLKHAPGTARLETFAAHQRGPGTAELLSLVREDPACLVADPSKDLRSFRVALSVPMGSKRGTGSRRLHRLRVERRGRLL